MARIDLACLAAFIVGFILFIYGANAEFFTGTSSDALNATIGWIGVFLSLGAIALVIVRYVYKEVTKNNQVQNP